MRCKYCGTELADKSKICYNCGRYLGDEQKDKAEAQKRRRIWIGIGIVAITLIFVLSTFGMNYRSQQSTNEVISTRVNTASANNLGLNAKDFIEAFNEHQLSNNMKVKIPENIDIVKSDANNSFRYSLTEHMLLDATLGKFDNKLLEINVIAQPSAAGDMRNFISCIGIMIDTFSPDVPVDQRRTILEELGFVKDKDLSTVNNSSVRGNTIYHLQFLNDVGFVFTVKNSNRR